MNRTALSLRAMIITGVLLVESLASAQYGEPRSGGSTAPPRTMPARSPATTHPPPPVEQALAAPVDPKVEHRLRLNAELATLTAERAKISLAGPLTLMIGGGVAIGLGLTFVVISGMHGPGDPQLLQTGWITVIAGGLSLGFGSVWLRALKPERRRLGLRIREVRRELQLLGGVGPDRASVGMRVQF